MNARLLSQVLRALRGERMPDGHVRGCPARLSSDAPCNLRCVQVREAVKAAEEAARGVDA